MANMFMLNDLLVKRFSINKLQGEYNSAAMAAAICSTQLQPAWILYRNNKTFRYSIYALEVLALAGLRQHTRKVSISILVVSALFLGQKIWAQYPKLCKIYARNRSISLDEQAALVSQLTQSLFAVILICGITLNGWNLSCVWKEGKCLVQGIRNHDLFNSIKAVDSLAQLGSIWGPVAFFLIEQGDHFFHSDFGVSVRSLVVNFLNAYKKNKELAFLIPYIDKLQSLKNNVPSPLALEIESFAYSFPEVHLKSFLKIMLILRWLDIGTPKVIRSKNPTLLQRIQTSVNDSLFYGFAFSMLGVRFYYHPIPTTAGFLCGLFCPTQMKARKDLKQRWERVPDFISLPLRKKFEYIFNRTHLTLGGLSFGCPGAFLKGLFLAEEFRYYMEPRLRSWFPFPIAPLIAYDNRWLIFLGPEFEKIMPYKTDQSDYQEFKRKILWGLSPRKLLSLEKGFSPEDIQKAYKKYCSQIHPDIPTNILRKEETSLLFRCLGEARGQLIGPEEPDLEIDMQKKPAASGPSCNPKLDETEQVD